MQVQRIDTMFSFVYEKSASEIKRQAETKRAEIKSKIEERLARIRKTRDEYKITDAVLIDIQNQMRAQAQNAMVAQYSSNVRSDDGEGDQTVTVGAGVVNFLLTEQDFISGEKAQVDHLDLMIRNIRDVDRRTANGTTYVELFRLSYAELKFLGF
jgi:hypothetical protein